MFTFKHHFQRAPEYLLLFVSHTSNIFSQKGKKNPNFIIFGSFSGSATPEICPMLIFRKFPHQITWKTNLWKLSRKSHVEYSHGLLNNSVIWLQKNSVPYCVLHAWAQRLRRLAGLRAPGRFFWLTALNQRCNSIILKNTQLWLRNGPQSTRLLIKSL